MKKNRGAQRKNKNALKHGFYSATFKAAESRLLNATPAADLTGEIELIRVATSRFLKALEQHPEALDPKNQLSALRGVTLGSRALLSLIRLQNLRDLADKDMDKFMDDLNRDPSSEPEDQNNEDDLLP